jgi:hypothetical protein
MPATSAKATVNRKTIQPPEEFDPNVFLHPQGHPRATIIIHDTGGTEPKQQFVGLNGYPFLIKKNEEISLPIPVINMLKNCIYTFHERDEVTDEEVVRSIPRFSISHVRGKKDNQGQGEEDGEWSDDGK